MFKIFLGEIDLKKKIHKSPVFFLWTAEKHVTFFSLSPLHLRCYTLLFAKNGNFLTKAKSQNLQKRSKESTEAFTKLFKWWKSRSYWNTRLTTIERKKNRKEIVKHFLSIVVLSHYTFLPLFINTAFCSFTLPCNRARARTLSFHSAYLLQMRLYTLYIESIHFAWITTKDDNKNGIFQAEWKSVTGTDLKAD